MKILLLDAFRDPGAARQCLAELLPAMAWRGWHGAVLTPAESGLSDPARAAGFATETIRGGLHLSGRNSLADLGQLLADTPRLAWRIRILTDQLEPDLLYLNGARLLPAVALADAGRPVVLHSLSYLPPGILRRAAGLALARMDARVIAACEFLAEPWREFVDRRRISVVYHGVPGPVRLAGRRSGGPPRIACIGRIAPEKGQRDFIAAAARIRDSLPECRFAIYGAAPSGDGSAARYAASVRLDAEGLPVQFAGWVSDVYGAMAGLDLLLVPSTGHEATMRVVLEAFAAGLPVIAYASGGIGEVIQNGVNGLLARDAVEMAELAILLLTGDPRRLVSISRGARASWEQRFHVERYHQDVLRSIESAAGVGVPVGTGR